jgi:hypothetical protein
MFGSGIIIMVFLIVSSLFVRGGGPREADSMKIHTGEG